MVTNPEMSFASFCLADYWELSNLELRGSPGKREVEIDGFYIENSL